ncbi:MAG: beta-lactamase family protein [Acidimicrobiia bacterium]|nr:beta-lactamase family protein [Acidimicrobiia bacterium]
MVAVDLAADLLHGSVAPGFERVQAEFRRNFEERSELGAACTIFHRGEKVVDLWGGYRDPQKRLPWQEDTLCIVQSVTKGLAAMTLAMLHSRGDLDYEERVATYWPEFEQNGKAQITVRQLLSHQAGLPCLEEGWDWDTLSDLDALAVVLARQRPIWEPGTRHGYHAMNLGLYENELVRRVDPQHRSLGRFFKEEIAEPLGIEFYIGLPEDVPTERIAQVQWPNPVTAVLQMMLKDIRASRFAFAMMNPKSMTTRAFSFTKGGAMAGDIDNPRYRGVEFASTGGIGRASAIALAYSAFATREGELGVSRNTLEMLAAADREPTEGIFDLVLKAEYRHSLGFGKPCPSFPIGRSSRSFGWGGLGGYMGYADPDDQVGFGYTMNRLSFQTGGDSRVTALMNAFYSCI